MRRETEKVYNTAFDLIEVRLQKKEQLHPFVVTLNNLDFKPEISMYEPVGQDTAEQIEIMRKDIKQKIEKQGIESLCICFDVSVTDPRTGQKTDAAQIELADRINGTVNIFVPYNFFDKEIIRKPFQVPSDQVYF